MSPTDPPHNLKYILPVSSHPHPNLIHSIARTHSYLSGSVVSTRAINTQNYVCLCLTIWKNVPLILIFI